MRERPDQELVALIRGGDGEAAGELFGRNLRQAWAASYAVARSREVADDALQDGVERAIRKLDRYDASRPFGPWFTRIVVNGTLEILRRDRGREEQSLERVSEEDLARAAEPLDRHLELDMALARLSAEQRAAVVLRLVLGYEAKEVAEMMGTETGTVHSRLSRALRDLRAILSRPQ